MDITDKRVIQALGNFLKEVFEDYSVFRGQVNRVPMPKEPLIIMNKISKTRLAFTENNYTDNGDIQTQDITIRTRYTMQIDFYGKNACDDVLKFVALMNNDYAYYLFPEDIKPLYTSEPVQMHLITGEKQYTERWKVEAEMQYNPVASVKQQFFDKFDIESIPF